MDPEAGHAVYHRALVLERLGQTIDSAAAFSNTNACDGGLQQPVHDNVGVASDG